MLPFDALFQRVGVVLLVFLHLIDEVVGCTVAGDGVGGGDDTDVLYLRSMRVRVAVAVDGDVVEHIDVDDVPLPNQLATACAAAAILSRKASCGCVYCQQSGVLLVTPCEWM